MAVLAFWYGCAPKPIKVYETETRTRSEVVQQAFNLLGKPYKNGAKGPDAFDCSGFIYFVYQRVGIALPVMTEGQIKSGSSLSGDSVQPGDLVFFKIKNDLHAGIMINKKDFIHASKSRGVAVDDINASYWRKSLIGFRSIL
ncbi:MAG: C40 family peptidase [Thermodesulfobacteriota bacterium]|jgi:cell wall-associated NlpC family hydrolase